MGVFTRHYNPESGWECVTSSLALPENVVVIDDDATPDAPIWRGHDYRPTAELRAAGLSPEEALEATPNVELLAQAADGEPSSAWTVPQLKAYAEAHDVDLAGATSKQQILDAIEAAKNESPTGSPATPTESGTTGDTQES